MGLTYTPQWASSSPNSPGDLPTSLGYAGEPKDMDDWRTFVRTVATRYKGKIHVYEIWNEPDRKQDWVGSVDTLVTMTRDASKILKEIDPSITVLGPCPETHPGGIKWLNEFLSKGGGQYLDAITYHFYVPNGTPEDMLPVIQSVKAVMAQNGVGNKPLWNSEAGWLGPNFFPDAQQPRLSRAPTF